MYWGDDRLGTAVSSSSSCTEWAGWRDEMQKPAAGARSHSLRETTAQMQHMAHSTRRPRWGLAAFQVRRIHEQPIITLDVSMGGCGVALPPRQVHDRFAPPRLLWPVP